MSMQCARVCAVLFAALSVALPGCGDDMDGGGDANANALDGSAAADGAPADGANDAGGSDAAPPGSYALDPATLIFYELPINSIRYAVSGHEPNLDVCVTLVWFVGDPMTGGYQFCGPEPAGSSVYAVVAPPDEDALPHGSRLCEIWDYGGNATVDDLMGCATFTDGFPTSGSADLVVTLQSPIIPGISGAIAIQGP